MDPLPAHPRYGQPSGQWTYRDPEGQDLFHVFRFAPPLGRKQFSALIWAAAGWQWTATLVELGWDPEEAIRRIRQERPYAIENSAQAQLVRQATLRAAGAPETGPDARRDRARGCLLGLAVGDAVGTTLEFSRRDAGPRLTDMIGGGPFRLTPGQWTDDTAMALALAESLLAHPNLDEADLMDRFVRWEAHGEYACTGTCFDVGNTVRGALRRYRATGNPVAGATDPLSAGNGSLMRLAPVALAHRDDQATRQRVAAQQGRTTHGADEAVDACVAFADLLAEAISGVPRHRVLAPRTQKSSPQVARILQGAWRTKTRDQIDSSGYVVHSLEAAVWAVARSIDFREAVLLAANLGDDADTVAAIAGQLASALWGESEIPPEWLERLAWRGPITALADRLFALSEDQ